MNNWHMAALMFVWLGSGRARKRSVGEAGIRLDQAARAGLPVPPGAILLDEFLQFCLGNGLAKIENARVAIPDPELMHNTLFYSVRLPPFQQPAFVRLISGIGNETSAWHMSQGHHEKAFDLHDPSQTAAALAVGWSAASRLPGVRADLLLMEALNYEITGSARTRQDETKDVATVLAGTTEPTEITLERRRYGRLLAPPAGQGYIRRLQLLLGGVRRTFGFGDWVIEWGDDGKICWLITISPGPGSCP